LNESGRNPGHFLKIALIEAFEEKTAIIPKHFGFKDDDALKRSWGGCVWHK
jgi:hypothetical protein